MNRIEFLCRTQSFAYLVCPQTKLKLSPFVIEEADQKAKAPLRPRADAINSAGKVSKAMGRTPWVMLREDLKCAYPIVDDIPILLWPESLFPAGYHKEADLTVDPYAESYSEMDFYNEVAAQEAKQFEHSDSYKGILPATSASRSEIGSFPYPRHLWLDSVYDCAAQWDAYMHLRPLKGKRVAQLGGKGGHAVKFLLAGASEAWAITPMLGEALCARALSAKIGKRDQLRCVVALAEELPIQSGTLDGIYSGGCLHHMQTETAFKEAARVLRKGGKFAATDPWRAPLYGIGTKLLGQREPRARVFCKPLTKMRLEPLWSSFSEARAVQHGTFTRYPLLALDKFGIRSSLSTAWCLNTIDDAICSLSPKLRGMGSSVAVLGTKS